MVFLIFILCLLDPALERLNLFALWKWLSHEAAELEVCVGQSVALCHFIWFAVAAHFQTQKHIFLPSMSVTFWTLQLSSGSRRRLAFSVHADTSETIGTWCHSPPFSVTMQQRPKTPKHSGNPGRSGPHSTLFKGLIAGICCAPADCTQRWTGEQNKVTERRRQQFKLCCSTPPRVKRWIPGAMPPWLYCVTEAAALHQTHGTHLPLRVAVMVPKTPGSPSGRNERGGRKAEMHKGERRWHV